MDDVIEKEFETVRENIRKYRKKKNMTQAQLSEAINITHDYLRQIETGIRNPSLKTIIRISKVVDVKLYQMFQ